MKRLLLLQAALLLGVIRPGLAQDPATGTGSACQDGLAGSAVTAPCVDPAVLAVNPAGLVTTGTGLGLSILRSTPRISYHFDRTGAESTRVGDEIHAADAFAALRWRGLTFGLGAWRPWTLRNEWPASFEGRFVGYRNELTGRYLHGVVAIDLLDGRLALGAGGIRVDADLAIARRLDLSQQQAELVPGTLGSYGVALHTDFADQRLTADGGGWSYQAGVLARPHPRVTVGIAHTGAVAVNMDGRTSFELIPTGVVLPPNNPLFYPPATRLDTLLDRSFREEGTFGPQEIATGVTFPSRTTAGVAYRATDQLRLMAEYQRTGWEVLDTLHISHRRAPVRGEPLGYRNTHALRLGGDLRLGRWTGRAGFALATPITPDHAVTPFLADSRSDGFSLGTGFQAWPELRVDAFYRYDVFADRRGRVRTRASTYDLDVDLSDGVFRIRRHAFGLGVVWTAGKGAP